ncbi:hypothetical protein LCGC14_1622390, partial [marine sediment metagenome]
MRALALAFVLTLAAGSALAQSWVAPMKLVRQNYTDTDGVSAGTIARFGDSITYSGAFFKPLRYAHTNTDAASQAALTWIQGWVTSASWTWQDDAVHLLHGNAGSTEASWALADTVQAGTRNIDYWLANDNPEIAVIMWGSNDIRGGASLGAYSSNM